MSDASTPEMIGVCGLEGKHLGSIDRWRVFHLQGAWKGDGLRWWYSLRLLEGKIPKRLEMVCKLDISAGDPGALTTSAVRMAVSNILAICMSLCVEHVSVRPAGDGCPGCTLGAECAIRSESMQESCFQES